jgi:tRNA threonylcarbamoyladenosine biosynthesis protein TsaE
MNVDFTLDAINTTAVDFLNILEKSKVIALYGEMGAGKTTFVNAVYTAMNVKDTVGSPTFSIINEYRTDDGNIIYHMDLYRLKDEEEAIAAGVEDALYSGNTCFVEWPEKIPGLLPENAVHCYLQTVGNNERNLKINL